MSCKSDEHNFTYKGVVYVVDETPRAGTGAKTVNYWEEYFCTKCLEKRHFAINERTNTYGPILFGATPKTIK